MDTDVPIDVGEIQRLEKQLKEIADDCTVQTKKYEAEYAFNRSVSTGMAVFAGAVPAMNIIYMLGGIQIMKSPLITLNVFLLGTSVWIYRMCEYDNSENKRAARDYGAIGVQIRDHLRFNHADKVRKEFGAFIENEYNNAIRKSSAIQPFWR